MSMGKKSSYGALKITIQNCFKEQTEESININRRTYLTSYTTLTYDSV
jgi:hypothetical protein